MARHYRPRCSVLDRSRAVFAGGPSALSTTSGRRAEALEALIKKLPSVDAEPVQPSRTLAGRAKQLKEEQEHNLMAAYEAGAKTHELSRRFRISRKTVHNILVRNGVILRHAGLNPEQIEEAIRL